MALNIRKTVFTVLKQHPQTQFTARELAHLIFTHNLEACNEKRKASNRLISDEDVITQIAAEIGAQRPSLQKKHPEIKTTEGRPKKYYFSKKSDEAEVNEVEHQSIKCHNFNSNAKINMTKKTFILYFVNISMMNSTFFLNE